MKKHKNLRERLFMFLGMSMSTLLILVTMLALPTIIPAISQNIHTLRLHRL